MTDFGAWMAEVATRVLDKLDLVIEQLTRIADALEKKDG
jgi:hypothetical protein